MEMNVKAIEKLQRIVGDANKIRGLKAWYEHKTMISTCDKRDAAFCVDDRFAVFDACRVTFDCYTGYYGNSGCSRPFSVSEPDSVKKAFLLTINKHKWEILNEMADHLMSEADALRDSAEVEIADVQALLDSIRKEAEAPCTFEAVKK
jgi:uncharacterized ParB-like nuclease family protein